MSWIARCDGGKPLLLSIAKVSRTPSRRWSPDHRTPVLCGVSDQIRRCTWEWIESDATKRVYWLESYHHNRTRIPVDDSANRTVTIYLLSQRTSNLPKKLSIPAASPVKYWAPVILQTIFRDWRILSFNGSLDFIDYIINGCTSWTLYASSLVFVATCRVEHFRRRVYETKPNASSTGFLSLIDKWRLFVNFVMLPWCWLGLSLYEASQTML